jgi:hypothetical protein
MSDHEAEGKQASSRLSSAAFRRLGRAGAASALLAVVAASCSADPDSFAAPRGRAGAPGSGLDGDASAGRPSAEGVSGAKSGGPVATSAGGSAGSIGRPSTSSGAGMGSFTAAGSGGLNGSGTPVGVAGGSGSGSGSGGSASSAGVPSGTPEECTPGARRCDASAKNAQTCSATGAWQSEPCEFVCVNDACAGVCLPGARQCNGAQPERCTDQGTWLADGTPCMAECEGGSCVGACRNDSTQCASSTEVKTCEGGQWGTQSKCEFACVDQKCGGVCQPQSTRCASGTELETCGETGQFTNKRSCDFVCVNDACGGACRPGDRRCKSTQQEEVCNAEGQWEAGQMCSLVCVGTSCGGVCKPNEFKCDGPHDGKSCNTQGQWEAKMCPNDACLNDACVACKPGSTKCASPTNVQVCAANGSWNASSKCEFACTDDDCGGSCVPGQAVCDENGKGEGQRCSDQGDFQDFVCKDDESCEKGVCGKSKKIVFITSKTYTGDLDGLNGADKLCRDHAAGKLNGEFKAFLGSSTVDIAARMSKQGTYYNTKNEVVADNWYELLRNNLRNKIAFDESGQPAPKTSIPSAQKEDFCDDGTVTTLVWANGDRSGNTTVKDNTCSDWTRSDHEFAVIGNYDSYDEWKYYCTLGYSAGPDFCANKAALICVQQ